MTFTLRIFSMGELNIEWFELINDIASYKIGIDQMETSALLSLKSLVEVEIEGRDKEYTKKRVFPATSSSDGE